MGRVMSAGGGLPALRKQLDRLYAERNDRKWVHPDPLEFLYGYPDPEDREIVALIASSLAYGRVSQILKSVSGVLETMGPCPGNFVRSTSPDRINSIFKDFKHRFSTGREMAALLIGVRNVLRRHGSLHACFLSRFSMEDATVMPALTAWVDELSESFDGPFNSLLPSPEKASACKRLHLFLRWLIREDGVDPGGWPLIHPSRLIIPLDTHMHRIGRRLGMTKRKGATLKTALEITEGFRKLAPHDPVRYDFSLTRLGIREDCSLADFLTRCGVKT